MKILRKMPAAPWRMDETPVRVPVRPESARIGPGGLLIPSVLLLLAPFFVGSALAQDEPGRLLRNCCLGAQLTAAHAPPSAPEGRRVAILPRIGPAMGASSMGEPWLTSSPSFLDLGLPQSSPALADSGGGGPVIRSIARPESTRYNWTGLVRDSAFFLAYEHAFRFGMQPNTRAELKGPFFKDWFQSVSHLRGWRDGDNFMTNYIGHPMQGGVCSFIYLQNDPRARRLVFGSGRDYWKSRFKAMLFSTIYSVQFEIGPIGESSLGNVGLKAKPESVHPQAWVDLVITPTVGMVWLLGEEALDRYFIARFEERLKFRIPRMILRGLLNPSRSYANMVRFKQPWYRDSRHGDATW